MSPPDEGSCGTVTPEPRNIGWGGLISCCLKTSDDWSHRTWLCLWKEISVMMRSHHAQELGRERRHPCRRDEHAGFR